MADGKRRIAVVEREIEGTDIHGDDVIIEPGRYKVMDSVHDWQGCVVLSIEIAGRLQAVSVRTGDIAIEVEMER